MLYCPALYGRVDLCLKLFEMKTLFLSGVILILTALIVTNCKKTLLPPGSNSNNNNSNNNTNIGTTDTTKPSSVGVPTGPSVSIFIPAGGGSISTADGRVEIDIPGGALPNGDTITIQNITNSAQSSAGDAYRFLPNGLKFAIPITIKFHYADSDVNGSLPQLLGIAYQDSAHFWEGIQLSGLDTVQQIISAQTNHFTDYIDFKTLYLQPIYGDLYALSKLFINKKETFAVYGVSTKNVGEEIPMNRCCTSVNGTGNNSSNSWYVNDIDGGSPQFGTASNATTANSGISSPGINSIIAGTYTAPAQAPSNSDNPVTLSTYVNLPQGVITQFINYLHYTFPPSGVDLRYKIKILDYNVYRLDIVDWDGIGCTNPINYYDSGDIFFRVGPQGAEEYTIPQDSIENFPPVAYPTSSYCGTCNYTWISEPVGSVNIAGASVSYTGTNFSYFVILKWDEADEQLPWYNVTCPDAGTSVDHKPPFGSQSLEVPLIINTQETNLDTLLNGSALQTHIRLTLVRSGMY